MLLLATTGASSILLGLSKVLFSSAMQQQMRAANKQTLRIILPLAMVITDLLSNFELSKTEHLHLQASVPLRIKSSVRLIRGVHQRPRSVINEPFGHYLKLRS